MKKILLVGGGTGGHILPMLNLVKLLIKKGAKTHLVVRDHILDRSIVEQNFHFKNNFFVHYLPAKKIHRFFSIENFTNALHIPFSVFYAWKILRKINPDVIFLKGGFVCFSVVLAAKLMRYRGKIYVHESDISAGTMGRFLEKSATKIFRNFGKNTTPLFYTEHDPKIQKSKIKNKNSLLVFGGSQGSVFLNKIIEQNQKKMAEIFSEILLITGPNKSFKIQNSKFKIVEFFSQHDLWQAIKKSELIIARSGASIFQIFAAQKKSILIPLPSSARNHQLKNAQYFAEKNMCCVLEEKNFSNEKFLDLIKKLLDDEVITEALKNNLIKSEHEQIAEEIILG